MTMGTWRIILEGAGIHDNGRLDDAESLAAKYAKNLQSHGHSVSKATFALVDSDGNDTETPRDLLATKEKENG